MSSDRPHSSDPPRTRLTDTLDELAGIDPDVATPCDEDAGTEQREALSEGFTDRVVASVQHRPRPTVRPPVWLRPAAMFPFLATLLLAAGGVAYFQWDGKWSERTLSYEEAIEIVFEGRQDPNYQRNALGLVLGYFRRIVVDLKLANGDAPEPPHVAAALAAFDLDLRRAASIDRPGPLHHGSFAIVADAIEGGDVGPEIVAAFLEQSRPGTAAIRFALASPDPALHRFARIGLRHLKSSIQTIRPSSRTGRHKRLLRRRERGG